MASTATTASAAELLRPTSRLFSFNGVDEEDRLDKDMSKVAVELTAKLASLTESERNNYLQSQASAGQDKLNELQLGLLYVVLTETAQAAAFGRYISFVSRDGFAFVVSKIKYFLSPKFAQLQRSTREQIVWFTGFLIECGAAEVDHLLLGLLKQIKGGDTTEGNIALAHSLMDLITRHRAWVERSGALVSSVWYHVTRLIVDHSRFNLLRQLEIDLSTRWIATRFQDCMMIGRDLIRLLHDVSRLPQFRPIWENVINSPTTLSPSFTGMHQLLMVPTPKRYLASRLTPAIEEQLVFMMENVRMGNQKRYQQWFMDEHLNGAESEFLLSDIMRFICCVYHPTNAILASDRVQRWVMVGWLLKCTKTTFVASSVKLCLFYDWMFFNPAADSIMNIEPAMLVMQNSLSRYKPITVMLLEFLVQIRTQFLPQLTELITNNLRVAVHSLLTKGVVSSLLPTFASDQLEPELRGHLTEFLGQFMQGQAPVSTPAGLGQRTASDEDQRPSQQPQEPMVTDSDAAVDASVRHLPTSLSLLGAIPVPAPATLSRKHSEDGTAMSGITPAPSAAAKPAGGSEPKLTGASVINQQLAGLMSSLKSELSRTSVANSNPAPLIDRYMETGGSVNILTTWSVQDELSQEIARFFLSSYGDEFSWDQSVSVFGGVGEGPLLKALMQRLSAVTQLSNNGQATAHSTAPSTAAAPNTSQAKRPGVATSSTSNSVTKRARLFRLLVALRSQQQHDAGPVLLVTATKHLKTLSARPLRDAVAANVDEIYTVSSDAQFASERLFSDDAAATAQSKLLEQDVLWVHQKDTAIFYELLPLWYRHFGATLCNNGEILHTALSTMDFTESLRICNYVSTRQTSLLGDKVKTATAVTKQSLQWETFEQLCFWQIVAAEFPGQTTLIPFLDGLGKVPFSYQDHSEAFAGLLTLLKGTPPDPPAMQFVLLQPLDALPWTQAILYVWENKFPKKFLKTFVSTLYQIADVLEGMPASSSSKKEGSGDVGEHTMASWKRKLETKSRDLALHVWEIAKSLSRDVGGESQLGEMDLVDHIDFCTALKRLLSILNMDEEFSFSYFMKAIKDQEDKFTAREEEALRQERVPIAPTKASEEANGQKKKGIAAPVAKMATPLDATMVLKKGSGSPVAGKKKQPPLAAASKRNEFSSESEDDNENPLGKPATKRGAAAAATKKRRVVNKKAAKNEEFIVEDEESEEDEEDGKLEEEPQVDQIHKRPKKQPKKRQAPADSVAGGDDVDDEDAHISESDDSEDDELSDAADDDKDDTGDYEDEEKGSKSTVKATKRKTSPSKRKAPAPDAASQPPSKRSKKAVEETTADPQASSASSSAAKRRRPVDSDSD